MALINLMNYTWSSFYLWAKQSSRFLKVFCSKALEAIFYLVRGKNEVWSE